MERYKVQVIILYPDRKGELGVVADADGDLPFVFTNVGSKVDWQAFLGEEPSSAQIELFGSPPKEGEKVTTYMLHLEGEQVEAILRRHRDLQLSPLSTVLRNFNLQKRFAEQGQILQAWEKEIAKTKASSKRYGVEVLILAYGERLSDELSVVVERSTASETGWILPFEELYPEEAAGDWVVHSFLDETGIQEEQIQLRVLGQRDEVDNKGKSWSIRTYYLRMDEKQIEQLLRLRSYLHLESFCDVQKHLDPSLLQNEVFIQERQAVRRKGWESIEKQMEEAWDRAAAKVRASQREQQPLKPTLEEVFEGADRASKRVQRWPQWMRDLSPSTASVKPPPQWKPENLVLRQGVFEATVSPSPIRSSLWLATVACKPALGWYPRSAGRTLEHGELETEEDAKAWCERVIEAWEALEAACEGPQ